MTSRQKIFISQVNKCNWPDTHETPVASKSLDNMILESHGIVGMMAMLRPWVQGFKRFW